MKDCPLTSKGREGRKAREGVSVQRRHPSLTSDPVQAQEVGGGALMLNDAGKTVVSRDRSSILADEKDTSITHGTSLVLSWLWVETTFAPVCSSAAPTMPRRNQRLSQSASGLKYHSWWRLSRLFARQTGYSRTQKCHEQNCHRTQKCKPLFFSAGNVNATQAPIQFGAFL